MKRASDPYNPEANPEERWDEHRYGTGSGSDRAPSKAASPLAPGRYRSRYRTDAACFDLGMLIAKVLAFAWQNPPAPLSLSAQSLREIAPLMLNKGAGALTWRRIRCSSLRDTEMAEELRQAYRLHTLEAALREIEIGQIFLFLRSLGLEPLMGKGWVIARQYPELGLRPYGDIDFYVRPEQHGAFESALQKPEAQGWNIDLHRGAAELDDRGFDELYARSRLVRLGEAEVRTFGPEDHLRLLCLHMLREGALRPLWLCDIAVALDSPPPDFDWDYFLSGNQRRSDWAACAIGLAHQLLGATVEGLPVAARAGNLPRWLVPVALRQWGKGKATKGRRAPMSDHLRHPSGALKSLWERWPNAIEATVGVNGPFNNWPRLPFQIGECVARTAGFARRIPGLLRASN